MCLHFPEQYTYCWDTLEKGCKATTNSIPPNQDLPFASITLNVGRRSCSSLHVDGSNLAGGLCLISPYGRFDWKKGGHIILHELKVVLALPPGSLTFIPSALISHENVPIGLNEERRVFTAHSPASLFQWVEHECQLLSLGTNQGKRKRGDGEEERRRQGDEVWRRQVRRFRRGHTF
jgi:hypothetical protein